MRNDYIEVGQRSHREKEAEELLEEYINEMDGRGFDFYFKNGAVHNDKSFNARRFLRKCVMHFECKNARCPVLKSGKKAKVWKSYYGLAFITYKFVDVVKKENENEFVVDIDEAKAMN